MSERNLTDKELQDISNKVLKIFIDEKMSVNQMLTTLALLTACTYIAHCKIVSENHFLFVMSEHFKLADRKGT